MGYSEADKRLMKKSDVKTPEGIATYLGMKAKQMLHKTGLTGKMLKDSDVPAPKKRQTASGILSEKKGVVERQQPPKNPAAIKAIKN